MSWTKYQLASILFDIISIVIIAAFYILKYVYFRNYSNSYIINRKSHTISKTYNFWHFWPSDIQFITKEITKNISVNINEAYKNKDEQVSISIDSIEIFEKGLIWEKKHQIEFDNINVEESYEFFSVYYVIVSFFLSAYAGLFLHFIPCFWWACDLGINDNGIARGIILLAIFIILFVLSFTPVFRQKGLIITSKNQETSIWVAFSLDEYNDLILYNKLNITDEIIKDID